MKGGQKMLRVDLQKHVPEGAYHDLFDVLFDDRPSLFGAARSPGGSGIPAGLAGSPRLSELGQTQPQDDRGTAGPIPRS